jgi:hypothetical protein
MNICYLRHDFQTENATLKVVSLEVSLFLQDTIVIEYDHMTSMKGLDHNLM